VKLIIALDYKEKKPAEMLVEQLNPAECALKVGLEMYTRFGPSWVNFLVQKGFRVFLDLKFHDIPNTVAQACQAAADLGVWMLNVHTLGGIKMLEAAKNALSFYSKPPILIGVTVLTSLVESDLLQCGISISLEKTIIQLAKMAHGCDLDGVVCPASATEAIKNVCGKQFLAVTPGIRLSGDEVHDQKQVLTPKDAVLLGSDYLVVGRSITEANSPLKSVRMILDSIASCDIISD
jgi:orotidine-5'-phosphate decarboxylase